MKNTTQFDVEELNDEAIGTILTPFKGRRVRIVVEEVEEGRQPSQFELYEKALKVRDRFKNSKIDPRINLSDLANEVNL